MQMVFNTRNVRKVYDNPILGHTTLKRFLGKMRGPWQGIAIDLRSWT